MPTVRIIAALSEDRANKLFAGLTPYRELEIIRRVRSEPELFVALRRELSGKAQSPDDPIVLITSFDPGDVVEQAYSRLLAEFPELIVYYVRRGETIRCRAATEIKHLATDNLLADLRSVSEGLAPAVTVVRSSSRGLDR